MKFPAAPFFWLMIPVAAAAGFFGNRYLRQGPGAASSSGTLSSTEMPSRGQETSRVTPKLPPYASAGVVKKWADRLRNCTAEELPGLYAEIQALKERMKGMNGGVDQSAERFSVYYGQRAALRLLCARWAELDPQGGFAFFNQLKASAEDDSVGRQWLLTEWAMRDPDTVYDLVTEQPAAKSRNDLATVGYSLMEESPETFWTWFRKARQPLPSSGSHDELWQALAAQHFDEMSAMAAGLLEASKTPKEGQVSSYELDSFYKLLGGVMADRDVDKALAWAKEQPAEVRGPALRGALKKLVQTSPEKIVDYVGELKPRQVGGNTFSGAGAGELIREAVQRMGESDPLKALKWLGDNKGKLGDDSYEGMNAVEETIGKAMKEGRLSPKEAFAAVRASEDINIRMNVASDMWKGLPVEQLAGTAQWLLTVDSKETRKQALQGIFPEWVKQDRAAALKFAAEVTDPELASNLYRGLAFSASSGLVSTQQERMTAALADIPAPFRADILADQMRMNYSGAASDYSPPFDGTRLVTALEGLPPSESTDKAVSKIAEAWGASDPLAAMNWAAGQSDAGLREKATGAAMESWAKEDAWGASQWIDSLPAGEQRDVAAHHLARVLRNDEPESAWTWAASISDPAIRLEARSAILRKWRDSGAANAQNAVENLPADLPAPERQKLLDTLNHQDAPK